jgi:GT2 family glycosyltransferase
MNETESSERFAGGPVDAPLVSVVMPAFNSAKHIGEALGSALGQDYPAIEIIVVDDGSTDDTRGIVAAFGPRVRLVAQNNQGAGAARNRGIREARGRYVAFLDADDVWWAHKIRAQVEALARSGCRMAYSRFIWWRADEMGRFTQPQAEFESRDSPNISTGDLVTGSPYAELLLDCIVWTSTVIVERAALDQVGVFDPDLRKGQDYDLWLRLSREIPMLGMQTPTALYRIHGSSITTSLKPVNYEYLILSRAIERWGERGPDGRSPPPGLVAERLARSCLNHALAHLQHGDPRIAATCLALSMHHSRIDLKRTGLWLQAVAKSRLAWFRPRRSDRIPD